MIERTYGIAKYTLEELADAQNYEEFSFSTVKDLAAHIRELQAEIEKLKAERDTHANFQQWANATEAARLNDARLEGWFAAQSQIAKLWDGKTYGVDAPVETYISRAIRELQPPAEWTSEQCEAAPNAATLTNEGTKWPHPDGFAGGLMGEKA